MKISGKIIDIIGKKIITGSLIIQDGRIEKIIHEDNAEDRFILPGLVDSHIHIESSMLVPSAFAETAVRHGTVAVVSDPHEIANVMGIDGVNFMIENAKEVPLKFYFGAPSCVPATGFESSGAVLGIKETEDLMSRKEIKYLSELMNFPGVLNDVEEVTGKIEIARKYGKPVDGHSPGLRGKDLKKYINSGISTDHESIDLDEAREKIGLGMKIQIREGSAARSLEKFHYLISENIDMLMICSDDLHPEMLKRGHINVLLKRLLEKGYDMFDVLKMISLNPVIHYDLDVGLLREGDPADFIIIDSVEAFNILETWINGRKVYGDGKVLFRSPEVKRVNNFNSSAIKPEDIRVVAAGGKLNVIVASDGDLVTGKNIVEVNSDGKYLLTDPGEDILKIIVKDRYNDGFPSVAFIKGFGLKKGAFASSVAHDSHNIIAVGVDNQSICQAVNMIVETRGGLAVCTGEDCFNIELPVAGIMSDVPCGTIAEEYEKLTEIVREIGCRLNSPFMTLSFMALLVIPELKISDKGLFDVNNFMFTDLFVTE